MVLCPLLRALTSSSLHLLLPTHHPHRIPDFQPAAGHGLQQPLLPLLLQAPTSPFPSGGRRPLLPTLRSSSLAEACFLVFLVFPTTCSN